MLRLITLFAILASVALAEIQVTYHYYSNRPPLASWLLTPYLQEGVWVAVRTTDYETTAFQITLVLETSTITHIVPRHRSSDPNLWTNDLFWIGKPRIRAIHVVELRSAALHQLEVGRDVAEQKP